MNSGNGRSKKGLIGIIVLVVVIILIVLAGIFAGHNKQGSSNHLKGYKYGQITLPVKDGSVCNASNYIAYEKGFFKKNGLKANLVSDPRTISDLEAGFSSGKYDAQNGDFQYLPAIQNGAPIKAVGGLHQGCVSVLVPKNSNIKSVEDLKGKSIGIPAQGSTPQYVASTALANAGLNPQKDVTWKDYSPDLLPQAAKKGEVQAIGTVDPYAYQAQKELGYRTIVDNNNSSGNESMEKLGMKKDGSCCYLYLGNRLIKSDPAKAKAIVKSYQEAAKWINDNPKPAANILVNDGWVSKSKFVNADNVADLLKSENYNYDLKNGKEDLDFYITQLKKANILNKDTDNSKLLKQAYWDPQSK